MSGRYRYWVQFILLLLAVGLVGLLLQGRVQDAETHAQRTATLLSLRRTEVRLDRDLLRVAAFRLQQYDDLVSIYRRIRQLMARVRQDAGPYRRTLDAWLEALDAKIHLAQRITSTAAVVRNELHYLDKTITAYHRADGPDANTFMEWGNALLAYALFGSDLRRRDLREALNRHLAGHSHRSPLQANILRHLDLTLDHVDSLQRLLRRYQELDTRMRFDALYTAFNQAYAAQVEGLERRRLWLAALAGLLVLLLARTLWGLERERRMAEQARQRLHDAVSSLSEGFALFDAQGRLVLYNPRFLGLYPWLRGRLGADTTYAHILRLHRQAGLDTCPLVDGHGREAEKTDGDPARLETFQDPGKGRRWLLASDAVTSSGERVLTRMDVTEAKAREQELARLYRAVEQSPVSVVITDAEGHIEYVNPQFERVTGYTQDEVLGKNPRVLKSGLTPKETYVALWTTLTRGEVWHGQLINRRKDGSTYWEEASIAPVRDPAGHTTHYIAVKEDISARKRSEEALRLHTAVFETLTEGVMITDPQQRILAVNPAFTRITGYRPDEVLGQTPCLLASGRHDPGFCAAQWRDLREQGWWEGEIQERRKDGEVYPAWMNIVTVRDAGGEVREYIAVFNDISQRKAAEARIRHQANFDALSGLPNRNLLLDRVARALLAAEREGWQVALLFVDLDRFKEVNDTLGHLMGDELLKQVAVRLTACVREADTVSRFGGDEFVILLNDVKRAQDAAEVARKVLTALERPLEVGGNELHIGASIGITLYPGDSKDAVTLLRNADMAMYRAKEAGRNTYQFYTADMNDRVRRRVALAGDLRHALGRGELFVVYQPIVRLADRTLVGFEALLRWHHPQQGPISPEIFIPLAEETGLIAALGRWVLETACAQARRWQEQGRSWRIGVNLSSRQLALGLEVAEVERILERIGLDPQRLTLEVTEGLMLDGSTGTLDWMRAIKDLGVRLSIDDFGTGYSSLSYLKRYPMDTLKIDRAFIRDLTSDPSDAALVKAILAMAHSLGIGVVAEGVENEAQIQFLEAHGCGFGQGWWFGRPVAAAEIETLIDKAQGRIESA